MIPRRLLRTGLVWLCVYPLVTAGLIALNSTMPALPLALKTLVLTLILVPLINLGIAPLTAALLPEKYQ